MDGFSGADPGELDSLARSMDEAADRLASAGAALDRAVASSTWSGPDASRFRSSWSAHRRRLQGTRDELAERADFVRAQAEDQRRASASTSATFLGTVPAGSALGDPVTFVAGGGTDSSPMAGSSAVGVSIGRKGEPADLDLAARAGVGARLGGEGAARDTRAISPTALVASMRDRLASAGRPDWLVAR